ncbi:MAG: hypothetical protein ACYTGP_05125 [Planctomycetota bacterium]|jgi:hypothetical protein
MSEPAGPLVRVACNCASAGLLIGSCAYLLFGSNKGLGIFMVVVAAVLSRVLILNIAERHDR